MKQYKAYLFDADGTLFDTTELIYQCFLYTCNRFYGITVDRHAVISNIGLPLRPQLELLVGELSDQRAEDMISAHIEYQLSIYKNYLKLFPGIKPALQKLKENNKKLAIVTSRKLNTLTLFLQHTDIYDYFDILITPEATKKHKPHPEPVLEALKQLNCLPEDAVFIGDALFDIECGTRAFIDTIFVGWSCNNVNSFSIKPTCNINSLYDLINQE